MAAPSDDPPPAADPPAELIAALGLGNPFELLSEMVGKYSQDADWRQFAFDQPILLAPPVHGELAERLEHEPALRKALAFLQDLSNELHVHPERYGPAYGPIERLWGRQHFGLMPEDDARALLRWDGLGRALTDPYLRHVCVMAYVRDEQGRAHDAAELAEFAVEVADRFGFDDAREQAVRSLLRHTAKALVDAPDRRLYRSAHDWGERLLTIAEHSGDHELVLALLSELAELHRMPYIVGRSTAALVQTQWLWEKRVAGGDNLMPDPDEMLVRAEEYLRRAIDRTDKRKRSYRLMDLVETLIWRRAYGAEIDDADIVANGEEALNELDALVDPMRVALLRHLLAHNGRPSSLTELEPLLAKTLDERVAELGSEETVLLFLWIATVVATVDFSRGPTLIRDVRPLARTVGKGIKRSQLEFELRLLAYPNQPDRQAPSQQELARALRFDPDGDPRDQLSALDRAIERSPMLAAQFDEALKFHRMGLSLRLATDLEAAEDHPATCGALGAAMVLALDLRQTDIARYCLNQIAAIARRPRGATAAVVAVAEHALRLQAALDDDAEEGLVELVIAALSSEAADRLELDPMKIAIATQMAKGMRFGADLRTGPAAFETDPVLEAFMSEIRQAEIAAAGSERFADEQELRLSAYFTSRSERSVTTAEGHLEGLQQGVDAEIGRRVRRPAADEPPAYVSFEEMAGAIGPRTVLLDCFVGTSSDNRVVIHLAAVTKETVHLGIARTYVERSQIVIEEAGAPVVTTVLGYMVALCRQRVQSEPGPGVVDLDDPESYANETYLGSLAKVLDKLSESGKDHLCVLPHGPLRFCPFHLLGQPGQPLADRWGVTYLSNVQLLNTYRGRVRPRRFRPHTLAAFGVGSGPPGFVPMPEATREAEKVAETFNITAQLDAAATPEAVATALEDARYVHVSAHGRHNVAAPSFQCLYLHPPTEKDDGRLFAYDILSLDLHGLRLVTLSACESSLGRFDTADNLRGLPANLLLAGAETIIGTLWRVEANASAHFFTSLYAALADGTSRLEAFTRAQRATRDRFPQYRDWGSFYLEGDWT
jgi:hypothetical protein